MLRLLKRNPLQWIPLHQITQTHLPINRRNVISNGAAINRQTCSFPFTVFFSSSAASKNFVQQSPERKDTVPDLLQTYGFSDIQIKQFMPRAPLIYSTEIIKPKLEYLLDFGFSPSELIKVIYSDPSIIASSLKERIAPNLSFLKATMGSKIHVIKSIIRGSWLLRDNLENNVIPNLKILRENTVPMDNVIHLFTRYPRILYKHPDVIIETIIKLKGLGMNPSTLTFIRGLNGMSGLKKETWERKMELYRSFGCSEEDTLSAFSRQPSCLQLSDGKIKKQMDFFTKKLKWDPALVLRRPVVLMLSLEKRTIPRCAVLNVLAKNGLWNGKPKLYTLLMSGEEKFEEDFVDKYGKEVPEVIDAYHGKIDFVGFES